jgi:hypothetical protein
MSRIPKTLGCKSPCKVLTNALYGIVYKSASSVGTGRCSHLERVRVLYPLTLGSYPPLFRHERLTEISLLMLWILQVCNIRCAILSHGRVDFVRPFLLHCWQDDFNPAFVRAKSRSTHVFSS